MKIPAKARLLKKTLVARSKARKRLRGPADLQYAIADSIGMLDATAWRSLTKEAGFFLSFDYLCALEKVLPLNLSARYALIYGENEDGGREAVAAVYMQIADIGLDQIRAEKPGREKKKLLPPLGKIVDNVVESTRQRVLTCGNLLCYGQHGIAFAPDVDLRLAWHGVAEVLYRVRQADRLRGRTHFVMIKDLHDPFTEHAKYLSHLSYRYVETEPNMVLTLDPGWASYDDYLASLAAKYRSSVRNQVFKPLDAAGCTIELIGELEPLQARMFELYKAVQANADIRPFELRPEYFAALQRVASPGFRCSVLRRGDEVLGFLMSVANGETAIAYHIGFDRKAAEELPIYLRLLHAGIADAIALGCKRISYGRTALEPKASLGAKPETFGILMRHRQPIVNRMLKHLLLGIEHDDSPERNPFKKAAAPAEA